MPFPRRTFLAGTGATAAAAGLGVPSAATPTTPSADLHWLDGPPPAPSGSTWGVPWSRGQVAKGTTFALATADGASVPVQSWPLAYWPDGSLKWTAHATGAETPVTGAFRLTAGVPAAPRHPVAVSKSGDEIRLGNGIVEVRLATHGPTPVRSIARNGDVVGHDGRLTLLLQGDTRWRDRIVVGMHDIAKFPAGLFTGEAGGAVGFDPVTGHLTNFGRGDFDGGYNLSMAFCGEQILWEALDLVDVPEFRRALLDFARYVQAPSAEKIARYGRDFNPQVFKTIYSRVTAWAGEQLADPAIRVRGWQQFTSDPSGQPWPPAVRVSGTAVPAPVDEIPTRTTTNPAGDFATFATNDFAQRTLAYIALLAIAPQEAP